MLTRRLGAALVLVLAGGLIPALTTRDNHAAAPAAAVRAAFHPAAVPDRVRSGRAQLARALGGGGVVESDRRTGGVRFAGRLDGFLTGPRRGDAAEIALGYVAGHRRVFGLDRNDLAHLRLADRSRSHGMTLLRWTQEIGGVPLLEGSLRAAVTDDGRLVNITGGARPALARPAEPRLDAAAAKRAAARATGTPPRGATATLVQTAATGRVRLAWRVVQLEGTPHYDQLIDAATGEEISRRDRTDHAVPGLVYDTYPGAPNGGTARSIDLAPYLHPGTTELVGPRARVYADPNGNDVADLGEHIFKDGQGTFNFTRTAFRDNPACPAAGCAWSPSFANSWQTNFKQAGTQLFGLLGQFADHLAAPPIGFDDFKDDFVPVKSDPVIGNVMDGAAGPNGQPMDEHWNNAQMFVTPQDSSPRIDAFLFYALDKFPALDPVDDASVIYHEYSHGLIGRTIVDPLGWGALNLRQPWALNEALADFFSLDYLVGRGLITDTAAPGEVHIGGHLFEPGEGRKEAIDCPVAVLNANCITHMAPGGLTYDDYGDVSDNGPEEHYDGEIMGQTMWQLRAELLAAHGQGEGENHIRSLAYTALQLAPPEPSFLDYRNAILQADKVLRGGQDAERIWKVFAERGMGWYASTTDPDDADPHADTRPGPTGNTGEGAIGGVVTDADTGMPVAGAKVALGGHTTANAALPGPFDTTTGADGRYRFGHVPAGTYAHLLVSRTGYADQVQRDVAVHGETQADVNVRRNWADTRAGAAIAGTDLGRFPGCPPEKLADGDRTTGWGTLLEGVDEGYVDIALPAAVRVTSFGVDPTPRTTIDVQPAGRCTMNPKSRPTRVRIEVSSSPGGPWKPAVTSELDATNEHRLTELRPNAALENVRFVRVHMIHPVDGRFKQLSFSEVQVYAATKRSPRAVFDYGPKPLDVAQTATFDASRSQPGDTPIARYEWDLDGDGSYETGTGTTPTATHAYAETGRYRVGLRVTDTSGGQDEFRALVLVARDVEIFDLGTLAPDDSGAAHALGISPRGAVAVSLGHPGVTDQMPGRYEGGAVHALDLPTGMVFGNTWAVNDAGQTVGPAYPAPQFGQVNAVLWNGSTPTMLGTLGGSSAIPAGLNANGWVVGWAYDSKDAPRGFLKRAGNPMVDVQEEGGVPAAQRTTMKLTKINDAGVAVGCSGYQRAGEGCADAVVYDGVARTLTKLPDFGFSAGLSGISPDSRTVVGRIYGADNVGRAALWHDGVPKLLGLLGGDSSAMAVNANGTVVGFFGDLIGDQAFLWRDGAGATMLDSLVPDTGWQLTEATGINDREEIVGAGTIGGEQHAYQLNVGPCRVCVTDVQMQEHDLPGATWKDVGGDGTVDGNEVRVRALVANHDDQPHVFQVKARDESRKQAITDQAPTVSLDPGEEQWVELSWDTAGLAWKDGAPDADHVLRVRAVLGHTIYGGRSTVLKVRPRPVALVPGALEDAGVWQDYADLLQRANPDWESRPVAGLDLGSWSNLNRTPETMGHHADVVAAAVAGIRGEEDAEHVDVVAHGLGGLIAREYVQDRMGQAADGGPVAKHLVQLGTPNLGTPCAELLDTDAWFDLRRDVVAAFNARVSDRKEVRFSSFAGDVDPYTCEPGTERGDGAVPVSSAQWTIDDTETGDVFHAAMPSSGAVFTDFVKPRLTGEHDIAARGAAAAADATPAVTSRSHQLLAQRTVTVPAGAAGVATPLDVDGGSRLNVTLLAPPEVKASLVAPDGAVAATADTGVTRSLAAEDPEPGRWTVRLKSTGTTPVQVALGATERDDPWSVDLMRGRPAAGGGLPVLAAITRFDRRVTDATVTLEVERRGGDPAPVTLLDDGRHGDGLPGDGCYGAEPQVAPGEAILRLRVRRGDAERVRASWADVPAPAGDGRRPACPNLRGRNGEIAFAQELWLGDEKDTWGTVDPEGALGSLPISTRQVDEARWSPVGDRLAWAENDEVYVGEPDGSAPVTVAGGDGLARDGVDWSPDGTQLAYARRCAGGAISSQHQECEIVVLDLATREERVITSGAAPTWSPDGESLAIARGESTQMMSVDLWTVRLEDGHLERLTSLGSGVDEPAWSPKGDLIAFSRYDEFSGETEFLRDQEIYLVDAGGGAVRNLTDDLECENGGCTPDRRDSAPSWSPDGRRIAFVSTHGEPNGPDETQPHTSQVWEMRPDGTGRRKRTSTATYKLTTAWRAVEFLAGTAAPRCFDLDVTTLEDKPVRIPLDCSDANGDRLTLRITEAPAHGTLGAIGEDGAVRYTPAAGYVGGDGFSYAASDDADSSAPAQVRVTVAAPPPPPPPPSSEPGPWVGGGSSGGGANHQGGQQSGGPVITIPGDCAVDPRTGFCMITVGCQPGGDITGCTGRFAEAPARARRTAIAARAGARLLKPVTVDIPAGQTRKVRLKLTPAGRAQLRRKGKLAIRIAIEVRAGGRVIESSTRRVVFRTARRVKK